MNQFVVKLEHGMTEAILTLAAAVTKHVLLPQMTNATLKHHLNILGPVAVAVQ